jgi:uncharacterized protein YukE
MRKRRPDMSDQFDVTPEDLVAHAANIEGLAERIGPIVDAMSSVTESTDAYGIICQFLPPVLSSRQEEQKELSEMARENLTMLAQAVRESAEAYEAADEETAEEHRGLEEAL